MGDKCFLRKVFCATPEVQTLHFFPMRITEMRGVHLQVTDALRSFIEGKILSLQKMCGGYSPCDVDIEVGKTIPDQQKGDIWRTQVRMAIPGHTFRVERIADDLYASIDLVKDELKRQLAEYKKR